MIIRLQTGIAHKLSLDWVITTFKLTARYELSGSNPGTHTLRSAELVNVVQIFKVENTAVDIYQ